MYVGVSQRQPLWLWLSGLGIHGQCRIACIIHTIWRPPSSFIGAILSQDAAIKSPSALYIMYDF